MSFKEDWSRILRLEKEYRQIHHYRRNEWALRVFLYLDCEGVGSYLYHKDHPAAYDDYHPRIDGFFPLFKADLRERLKEIWAQLDQGREEEAEELLVAIPKYLRGLESVQEY